MYDEIANAILAYVDDNSSIDQLELAFVDAQESEYSTMLNDLHHALRHYDTDIMMLDEAEANAMKHKMSRIARMLLASEMENVDKAISEFFNNPYTQ